MKLLLELQAAYLDWVNHFMSISRYADAYGLSTTQAEMLINLGRLVHEDIVAGIKPSPTT